MDSVSEARLALVYPPLAEAVRKMAAMLAEEGIIIRVVQGLRTWAEQDELYRQGRFGDPRPIVTNAQGGYSWHNFGLAVDVAPLMVGGVKIDWDASHPNWKRMEAVGVSLGLTSGANWKRIVDAPHFQLTGKFPENAPNDEVRQIMRDKGMPALWDAVTASLT